MLGTLEPGASIADAAGGYGRYGERLARAGYKVTIFDIDPAHMEEARRRAAALPEGSGEMHVVEADLVAGDLSRFKGRFDALLCTGLLYLAPMHVLRGAFHQMAGLLRQGGLSVVEFATDRERYDADGNPLLGADEQRYTRRQGELIMRRLHAETGIVGTKLTGAEIDLRYPYRYHANLIFASGTKVGK